MNTKLVTVAIVSIIALFGFGAIMLSQNENSSDKSHNSSEDHMSGQPKQPEQSASKAELQESNMVTYKDFEVVPKTIKVKKGTTVTWTNDDTAKHDVTPDQETAEFKASQLFGKGETYSVTFNTQGTYSYYCSPHPYMKGTVEVTE